MGILWVHTGAIVCMVLSMKRTEDNGVCVCVCVGGGGGGGLMGKKKKK